MPKNTLMVELVRKSKSHVWIYCLLLRFRHGPQKLRYRLLEVNSCSLNEPISMNKQKGHLRKI
jgi:hypothetical protein